MKRLKINQPIIFPLLVAIFICAFRIALFDGPVIFSLRGIVPHDEFSAVPLFASTVHSEFLNGEIAWWLSADTNGGYAQYYNLFLSPLAPTAGHIPFMIWCDLIRFISFSGIHIAEYTQYLIFNLIFEPFLCYYALALLSGRFFKRRFSTVICVVCYAFGGTGIWNNSWMFYQEWFCLFLFLYALDRVVRGGGILSLIIFAFSIINWVSSINYWTVFSSWFVVAFIVLHYFVYRYQWKKIPVRIKSIFPLQKFHTITALMVIISCVGWIILIASIYMEQGSNLVRGEDSDGGFSVDYAVQAASTRSDFVRITVGLFNPNSYANSVHLAHYISIAIGVLFIFAPNLKLGRPQRIFSSLIVFCYCILFIGGPFRLLYSLTPGMQMIRHTFYFYTYFLQISLIMMGCYLFDALLRGGVFQRWINRTMYIFIMAGSIIFLMIDNKSLENVSVAQNETALTILLFLLSAVLIAVMAEGRSSEKRFTAAIFTLFIICDMSRYYVIISTEDQEHTRKYIHPEVKYKENGENIDEIKQKLRSKWSIPENINAFYFDGDSLLPFKTALWTYNTFNTSRDYIEFYKKASDDLTYAKVNPRSAVNFAAELSKLPDGTPLADMSGPGSGIPFKFRDWSYNDFRVDVDAGQGGYLIPRINYDPLWKIRVDGEPVAIEKVDYRFMAFPITAGHHIIDFNFEPLARYLFGPLRIFTYLSCIMLIIVAWVNRRNRLVTTEIALKTATLS